MIGGKLPLDFTNQYCSLKVLDLLTLNEMNIILTLKIRLIYIKERFE